MDKNDKKYMGLKRPTVTLTKEEHKKIAIYCLENDLKIGDFLKQAGLYCVDKNIIPGLHIRKKK